MISFLYFSRFDRVLVESGRSVARIAYFEAQSIFLTLVEVNERNAGVWLHLRYESMLLSCFRVETKINFVIAFIFVWIFEFSVGVVLYF